MDLDLIYCYEGFLRSRKGSNKLYEIKIYQVNIFKRN